MFVLSSYLKKFVTLTFLLSIIFGAIFLVSAQKTHAQGFVFQDATSIQQTIDSLFKQIDELQAQLIEINKQNDSGQGCNSPDCADQSSVLTCSYSWNRPLYQGSQGDDVSNLQTFLTQEGHYNDAVTGFFGPITEKAVQSFQEANSIVSSGNAWTTGYGNVGPSTRDLLNRKCKDWTTPPETVRGKIEVDPTSGDFPLKVTFTSGYGDKSADRPSKSDGQDTFLDFGDGSDYEWLQCDSSEYTRGEFVSSGATNGLCDDEIQIEHTYEEAGVYKARVVRAGGRCDFNKPCPVTVLDTVTIEAGETNDSEESSECDSVNAWFGCQTYSQGSYSPDEGTATSCEDCDSPYPQEPSWQVTGCYDGGVYRPEGYRTDTYTPKDSIFSLAISDGVYVCTDGEWKLEGGYPTETETPTLLGCYDGGIYRAEGYTTNIYTDEEGWEKGIDDSYFECESGGWVIKGSYPEEPECDSVNAWFGCQTYSQGSYTPDQAGSAWGTVQGASTTNVIEQLKQVVSELGELAAALQVSR